MKEKTFDIFIAFLDFVITYCICFAGIDYYYEDRFVSSIICFILCVTFICDGLKRLTDNFKLIDDSKRIQVKYHSTKIEPLQYIDGKSDWIDLRSAENVTLKKDEFRLVNLGISMKLPRGYEAYIVPRSSTFKNFGIIQTNHMGIIDETYCGDNDIWMMPVYALRDTEINIGDRICQFRIEKHQPKLSFIPTRKLGDEYRGGFGSTGKR